ncbi:triose-phosphate isomerase [Aliifodinibius salipaludis]|uniref:Triosephosphate isomerase n=1 Tax=Fodinibius salipaludis TaxID=2032627 RepID=A0A2A2GFK9_9BACT|nr:triose-phosphate isomerase [Aliifodinibius salipaludis]PAU95645.1 triose-phosphate isomerase [Aliifodinibius salipaludis]
MRRFLIAGNWKMNCGPQETSTLLQEIENIIGNMPEAVDGLVCPPTISLTTASVELQNIEGLALGAQNVHSEDNGAFTGEVSTEMLNEVNCEYVILGHSERRQYFGETDKTVNAKVNKALNDGLKPVICVGESLEQRKADEHKLRVKKQIQAALIGVEDEDASNLVIAYEPIWAIGTGETATPDQAQEMHKMIRKEIADLYSDDAANQIRILYGGSMKPHNAEELLEQPDVDGGLIGGASLKADSFTDIIHIAEELAKSN